MAVTAVKQPQNVPETASITGLYLNEYQEIVKPHQQLLISDYFINHWIRRLKPTLSWIVVALQQACWRADDDRCTISQAKLCEEIGINRTTVTRALKNPWRHWLIPAVTYNKATFNPKKRSFQPLPAQYSVFLTPPLTPDHLTGLYTYLKSADTPTHNVSDVEAAIYALTSQPTKEALKTLEASVGEETLFPDPLPLTQVVEQATDIKFDQLSAAKSEKLSRQLSTLQTHLTRGDTLCRQYFRLTWVPQLGSSMAWLVMALRSRCYYNKSSGELRDVYTWRKKDLADIVGQSTQNLRTRLLRHAYADHFFQIIADEKHKITLQVGMLEEPLTTELAPEYWQRQAENANFYNIDENETQTFATSSSPERKLLQHRFDQNANNRNIGHDKTQTFATQSPKTLSHQDSQKESIQQKTNTNTGGVSDTFSAKIHPINPPQIDRKQQLFDLLCRLPKQGMQPAIARQVLDALPEEALIQWLHYVAEDQSVIDPVRLLVTNVLRRRLLPPEVPLDPAQLQARHAREIGWGLRSADDIANAPSDPFTQNPEGAEAISAEAQLWTEVLDQLRLQMPRATFDAWLRDTELAEIAGNVCTILVKNQQAKAWLSNRLSSSIIRALTQVLGQAVAVNFVIWEDWSGSVS